MKKKWKYEIVNNQEDEEGYCLYPDSVLICESAKRKQDVNSNKNTVNTNPGSAKLVMISSEVRRRISQFTLSLSAKQAAPVATGTMGNQKDFY